MTQQEEFVSNLKELGGSAGNMKLRGRLGWAESTYDAVKAELLQKGTIVSGRGKGGSVALASGTPQKGPKAVQTEKQSFTENKSEPSPEPSKPDTEEVKERSSSTGETDKTGKYLPSTYDNEIGAVDYAKRFSDYKRTSYVYHEGKEYLVSGLAPKDHKGEHIVTCFDARVIWRKRAEANNSVAQTTNLV